MQAPFAVSGQRGTCHVAVSLLDHVRQNKHERYAVSGGVTL